MSQSKKKYTILLVEDDQALSETLADYFMVKGYIFDVCINAEDALKKLTKRLYNIIISDIMMPGMGGLKFIERLKKDKQLQNIPFIFISSKATSNDLRTGMNLGADDYLFKPFKLKDLEASMLRVSSAKESVKKGISSVKKRLEIEKRKREKLEYYSSHIVRKHISNAQGIIELLSSEYPNEDLINLLKDEIDSLNDISIKQVHTETSTNPLSTNPKNILIVDDDEVSLFYNKRMVELFMKPATIHTLSNPIKVSEYLKGRGNNTDLILLDLNMPKMNGLDLLEELFQNKLLRPTIILSYDLSAVNRKDLSMFEVMEVWTKPVTEEQINEFLDTYL